MRFTLFIFALLSSLSIYAVQVPQTPHTLKVTTFNAGLAHTFIPFAKQRIKYITKSLQGLDSDVVCLQEVWNKKDRKKVKKALQKKFPFSMIAKIKNLKSKNLPTCKVRDLFGEGKFVGCMRKNCSGLSGDEFTDCIIDTCDPSLRRLKNENRECASSLMAQVGRNTILGLLTILNPVKRAGLFSYRGSNGLMLFSKYPLVEKKVLSFQDISTTSKREVLVAKVKKGEHKVKVMCTHITANLEKTVPYTGKFQSWEEENLAQIKLLLKEAEKESNPLILLGDFNCGESNVNEGIDGELENNCKFLHHQDFTNALKSMDPSCTFCSSNHLNDDDSENSMIDHIFVRGLTPTKASVIFKDPIEIKVKKKNITTNLSDHYGVHTELILK